MTANPARGRAFVFIGLYAAVWAAATAYLFVRQADWTFPLISMGIFGLALSGIGWALTRKTRPHPIRVARPGLELSAVLVFMAIYAVAFLGPGMSFLRHAVSAGRDQELLVMTAKLTVHVVLPSLLLVLLGASLRPLFTAHLDRKGVLPTLVVLGAILIGLLCVVSPSLKQIGVLHPTIATLAWATPACFAWIALEAGLCEEFLFRAVLQTRLAAVLKSEVGAVVIGALVFALAHAPGLYLRGDASTDGWSTDPLQVIAFTVASLSPLALLFGTLWARTRSLLLVVALHACVDLMPGLPEFLTTWAGLR